MDEIVASASAESARENVEVVLEAKGLNAWYGKRQVLHGVDFEVLDRCVTAIIGPSGCGKSTLLTCMNRTIELVSGARACDAVSLHGRPIAQMSPDEVRSRIGMVMQKPTPLPFSIERNITYALRYKKRCCSRALKAVVAEQLSRVGLLDEIDGETRRSALELSGGQQQRLCIARALALEPDVLMLDEPCSALDVASSKVIEGVLADVAKSCAVVVVTHNLAQARRLSDNVICLDSGRVAWKGSTTDLFEKHRDDVLASLYGGDLL